MNNGQSAQVDLQTAFEALRFQAGQEIARLLTEIAMRDALITQLQTEPEQQKGEEVVASSSPSS